MKSSRGSQDPEQQEEACRTEGGLTVAMGRLPRVACLCLGQSAFIPDLLPAALPFLPSSLPRDLPAGHLTYFKGKSERPRQKMLESVSSSNLKLTYRLGFLERMRYNHGFHLF